MQSYGDTHRTILRKCLIYSLVSDFMVWGSGEWKPCRCIRRVLTSPPQLKDISCSMPMYSMSWRPPGDITLWNALPLGNASWVRIQLLCAAILDFSALCFSYIHSIMNMLESKATFSNIRFVSSWKYMLTVLTVSLLHVKQIIWGSDIKLSPMRESPHRSLVVLTITLICLKVYDITLIGPKSHKHKYCHQ